MSKQKKIGYKTSKKKFKANCKKCGSTALLSNIPIILQPQVY